MTIEQIHDLLWWPPNSYKAGDLVAFGPYLVALQSAQRNRSGKLMYNGQNNFSFNQEKSATWATERYFSFILDFPRQYGFHMEDIQLHPSPSTGTLDVAVPMSAARNPIWTAPMGTFENYIVSLRVMGYLIDSWEFSGKVVLTNSHIIFAPDTKCRHHTPSTARTFTASADGTTITARYSRPAMPNIEFRYTVPRGTDYCAAMRYFNSHPRNFFLSCVRANLIKKPWFAAGLAGP